MRERLAGAYVECRQIVARVVDQVERFQDPHADPDRLPAGLLAEGSNVFLSGLMAVAGTAVVDRDA